MKKRLPGALALLLCLCMLAGCASAAAQNLTDEVAARPVGDAVAEEDSLRGLRAFSETLFEQVRAKGGQNIALSPLSAFIALSMAAQGAVGDTAKEFEQTLLVGAAEGNALCFALMRDLMQERGNTSLNIADSLWIDEQIPVKDDFIQTMKDYYASDVFHTDLQASSTIEGVNKWVSDATQGLIPELIEAVDARAALLLINTLYMNAKWLEPFDVNNTHLQDFARGAETTVQAEFMHSRIGTRMVIDTDDALGVLLPYDDGRLAFLAVKPKGDRFGKLTLDGGSIARWADAAQEKESVLVTMPKFSLEYGASLDDMLKAMGLAGAYDAMRADFTAMGGDADNRLYIGSVIQKVSMRVDEEGTEAAAATKVEMVATGAMLDFFEVTFDSPYVYAVVDMETKAPLFIGTMDNPAAQ